MSGLRWLLTRPWLLSFAGGFLVWIAAIVFTGGYGAGGMMTAALALAVFTVVVGVGQMFVIALGPGNVDLSLPANIGLASAVAMKVMDGQDARLVAGLVAALACGAAIGVANYVLIWALRIPPIIATLSASFIIQSIDISFGRGLQIKPPPGFADFASLQVLGVPVLAGLTLVFTIGAAILLDRTIYGRSVLAAGQNMRAARLAGIAVERTRFLTYVLSGALAGIDGALLAGYFRGANVDLGNEYLLGGDRPAARPAPVPRAAPHHAQHLRGQRRRAAGPDRPDHRGGDDGGGRRERPALGIAVSRPRRLASLRSP